MTTNQTVEATFLARAKDHWTPEREAKVTGKKAWPITPSTAAPLLRVLGLLNADASMPADSVRKLSQINHMVTLLMPQITDLAERHPVVRIFDAGCGTSALSLVVGWLFRERFKKPVRVVGIDANAAVIATSTKRSVALGLDESVRFLASDLASVTWPTVYAQLFPEDAAAQHGSAPAPGQEPQEDKTPRPHLVIALHACDMATDEAAALGVAVAADVIALAPCCHAELAKKWKDFAGVEGAEKAHPFAPIFHSPNLRRETAAQITDAMRMLLLRSRGYEVTATEFVPSAHTPKNRLLLCTRRGRYQSDADRQYDDLTAAVGGSGIKLRDLLAPGIRDGA